MPLGFWRGAQGLASMNEELLHELWRWVALGDCVSGVTGHHRDKLWRAIRQPRKCYLVQTTGPSKSVLHIQLGGDIFSGVCI